MEPIIDPANEQNQTVEKQVLDRKPNISALTKFCFILALSPIVGLPLYLLGLWLGLCRNVHATSRLCEILGLSFPWGLFLTVPAAIVIGIFGFVVKKIKNYSEKKHL